MNSNKQGRQGVDWTKLILYPLYCTKRKINLSKKNLLPLNSRYVIFSILSRLYFFLLPVKCLNVLSTNLNLNYST